MSNNLNVNDLHAQSLNIRRKIFLAAETLLRILQFILSITAIGLCCRVLVDFTNYQIIYGTIAAILALLGAVFCFIFIVLRSRIHPILPLVVDVINCLDTFIAGILLAIYFYNYSCKKTKKILSNNSWYSLSTVNSTCRMGNVIAGLLITLGFLLGLLIIIDAIKLYTNKQQESLDNNNNNGPIFGPMDNNPNNSNNNDNNNNNNIVPNNVAPTPYHGNTNNV